jgi:hypothetical protein
MCLTTPLKDQCGSPARFLESPLPFVYRCRLHHLERGLIYVFMPLASRKSPALAEAKQGQRIPEQRVVVGGVPPLRTADQRFQIVDDQNRIILAGSGIGPGLSLGPMSDHSGIGVTGTPTVAGTCRFWFTVTDGAEHNLTPDGFSINPAAVVVASPAVRKRPQLPVAPRRGLRMPPIAAGTPSDWYAAHARC